ncbi:MAG TPA: universal stress protein [Xanthobacteraceae bacterium]|nr:universal stress protein [Xanthobacteraceae bacterium]
MIKDLVVNLAVGGSRGDPGAYAVSIAEAFGAHVAAIGFAHDPIIPATLMGGIPADFIESQRAEAEASASAAIARFEEAARRAGVSAESRLLAASIAEASDQFGRIARRFDLAVVGQAEPDKASPEELIAESALFGGGRPVLVVPYIQTAGIKLGKVLVCWDGSRSAARSAGDAMPFLARADEIEILIVSGERGKSDEIPGADIGQHLARHDLKVDVKRIVATESDVANTILSYVADSSADMIVMGGYGHSRLREFILGGVTRGILEAMTVPTLMSH